MKSAIKLVLFSGLLFLQSQVCYSQENTNEKNKTGNNQKIEKESKLDEVPEVDVKVPDNDIDIPDSSIDIPDNEIDEPDNDIDEPDIDVHVPEINVAIPEINIAIPDINVSVPEVNVSVPEVNVSVPEVNVMREIRIKGEGINKLIDSFKVASGGHLNVNLNQGHIRIIPWAKNEVVVKVQDISEEDAKNVKASYDKNSVVNVEFDTDWGNSSDAIFIINVPAKYNLDLNTRAGDIWITDNIEGIVNSKTNGGEIQIKSVKGDINLDTHGGDIQTGDIEGSIDINTMGGEIRMGILKGLSTKVNTMGGDIVINKSTSGVSAKTMGGDIRVGDLGGESSLTTFGGDITVGNVSGGIKMETYGGDLKLESAKGKVSAKTMGGDIKLRKISGSVYAKTLAGEVKVNLNPDQNSISELITNSGGVELTIPASVHATIEAKISIHGYNPDSNPDEKIISDFTSSTYNVKSNEIRATYVINGGGSKISIRSVDSGIKILKSIK